MGGIIMKARVKYNNEIIDVIQVGTKTHLYDLNNVEFLDNPQDYWTRLEHQYAGMAMQGMSENFFKEYRDCCAGFGEMDIDEAKATMKDFADAMADVCYYFAHALVEKYKKEE